MKTEYWECQVCGATAIHTPRKNSIEYACTKRCDWQVANEINLPGESDGSSNGST